jgi:hypothetical protein
MDSEAKNDGQSRRARAGGGRAYRSRLESFVDFIRTQRQQRRTWKEIAERLHTEKGCAITFQGVHQFYRRYVKRQSREHWEGPIASQPTRPDRAASRLECQRPVLAATPIARPFRQPNPINLNLNDPTKI